MIVITEDDVEDDNAADESAIEGVSLSMMVDSGVGDVTGVNDCPD